MKRTYFETVSSDRRGYTLRLACLVIAASAFFSASRSYGVENALQLKLSADEIKAAGIATTAVESNTAGQYLSFPSTVVVPPNQASVVAAPVTGIVEAILVAQDEMVAKDQVIATLRSPQVVEAQQLYLAALTDEKLASDKLRRADSLYRVKAMSEAQMELARAEYVHAQARVDERLQLLQLMGVAPDDIEMLRSTRKISNAIAIRAPKSGIVIERSVKQGTRVEAAAPLFTLGVLKPLWLSIQVPASRLGLIREGKQVTLPAQGASGKVIRVGKIIDPATQSTGVIAEIDTFGDNVRPGLISSATIRIDGVDKDRWSVPIASVVRHRGRSWVFVQTSEGFSATPVEVIAENGQRTAIAAALNAGDRVAYQGVLALVAELAERDGR